MLARPTRLITLGIFGVFLFGLIVCSAEIWHTSDDLYKIKTGMTPPETRIGSICRNSNCSMDKAVRSNPSWSVSKATRSGATTRCHGA